jgi:hypothetical protein
MAQCAVLCFDVRVGGEGQRRRDGANVLVFANASGKNRKSRPAPRAVSAVAPGVSENASTRGLACWLVVGPSVVVGGAQALPLTFIRRCLDEEGAVVVVVKEEENFGGRWLGGGEKKKKPEYASLSTHVNVDMCGCGSERCCYGVWRRVASESVDAPACLLHGGEPEERHG